MYLLIIIFFLVFTCVISSFLSLSSSPFLFPLLCLFCLLQLCSLLFCYFLIFFLPVLVFFVFPTPYITSLSFSFYILPPAMSLPFALLLFLLLFLSLPLFLPFPLPCCPSSFPLSLPSFFSPLSPIAAFLCRLPLLNLFLFLLCSLLLVLFLIFLSFSTDFLSPSSLPVFEEKAFKNCTA